MSKKQKAGQWDKDMVSHRENDLSLGPKAGRGLMMAGLGFCSMMSGKPPEGLRHTEATI